MTGRPVYLLRLRPEPGTDAVRALKQLLKYAARACGLRCIEVREAGTTTRATQNDTGAPHDVAPDKLEK